MSSGLSKRCWAEVDMAALERNVGRIRTALPKGVRYISVVKADAYGHGMPQVVPRLMEKYVDAFAVANCWEGSMIREIGQGWPILVLSALLPEEDELLIKYNLIGTVSNAQEVARLETLGAKRGKPIKVHLKIDTGMGRSGVWYEEATSLYNKIKATQYVQLDGVYTHFPSADNDHEFTQAQRTIFKNTLATFKGLDKSKLWVHADNSAGLETFDNTLGVNAVRVGLMQFGVLPSHGPILEKIGVEPVLSLKSRVGLVKDLPAGVKVSYGRTHELKRNSKLAILTAGYGDGVAFGLGNQGEVIIRGKRYPVVGRVTMDQTLVDVTDAPEVAIGDEVLLIGRDQAASINIDEWSNWAGTIAWDAYCSITKRVPRNYLNNRFS